MIRLAQIHQVLESLGLSGYESKAYSGLLKEHPVTGYRLSKISGVPRSRIYETLERLRIKGFVLVQEGKPAKYIPVAGEEFILKTERSLFDKVDILREWFDTLSYEKGADQGIWKMEGRNNILNKAEFMIHNAVRTIMICAWADDLRKIQSSLQQAAKRDLKILIVSCGKFEQSFTENQYIHSWEGERKSNIHDFTLVVDNSGTLIGSTTPEEKCSAAWTESQGVVFVAREYILHEIIINRLLNYIPPGIKRELMAFYNKTLNI